MSGIIPTTGTEDGGGRKPRRVGALPEIIRDGIDGFFGDDANQMAYLIDRVDGLDRAAIRESVIDRFSAGRMTDGYEAIYRELISAAGGGQGIVEADAGRSPEPRPLKPVMGDLSSAGRAS